MTEYNGKTKLAVSLRDELRFHSEKMYHNLIDKCESLKEKYPTYESWLETHFCPCGKHGKDGLQPYGEVFESDT